MVLAHQGGWDEILMVAAPVAIFCVLLFIANRRANALAEAQHPDADADAGPDADQGDGGPG